MNDKALTIQEIPPEQIELIKRTVAKGATDDELALFLHQANKTGLDPLSRQIHFSKFKDKIAIITGIDGYRLVADRTGKYAGSDDYLFDDGLTQYESMKGGSPQIATATVWKLVGNQRVAFSASASWDAYCPPSGRDFMWKKMPHFMLGKCAEGLALRKAFPAELSGVYVREEMEQAGVEGTGEWEDAGAPLITGGKVGLVDEEDQAPASPVVVEPKAARLAPRPYSPEDLREQLNINSSRFQEEQATVTKGQRGYMVGTFTTTAGGEEERHDVLEYLTGNPSTKKLGANYVLALLKWMEDETMAVAEAGQVLEELGEQNE